MMLFVKNFVGSLIVMGLLDFIWLGFVAKKFNLEQLREIGRIENNTFNVHMPAALVVYLFMALLMALFVMPRVEGQSLLASFFIGAAMGLSIYAVFDMTNYAILKNYPLPFALVDMAWGMTLFAVTTVILSLFKIK